METQAAGKAEKVARQREGELAVGRGRGSARRLSGVPGEREEGPDNKLTSGLKWETSLNLDSPPWRKNRVCGKDDVGC